MESANVLYGVTMEPGGSSTVVRKELSMASSTANMSPGESVRA
jgi:chromosome segregation ATPase